jgi:hypothetical protein
MSDQELWVETNGFGRCRLDGNAHTFPGRISAWSEALAEWVTIDRRDVRNASAEAWAWIDGFLAGNEPELHEFLGVEPHEAMDADEATEKRWQSTLQEFHRTGVLQFPLDPRPRVAPPADLSASPWVLVGGQVLRWDGADWTAEDPQPELHYATLAGTICDQRGHHLMEEGDERFAACRDCGALSELAPRS